jgi:hypothetical protein
LPFAPGFNRSDSLAQREVPVGSTFFLVHRSAHARFGPGVVTRRDAVQQHKNHSQRLKFLRTGTVQKCEKHKEL